MICLASSTCSRAVLSPRLPRCSESRLADSRRRCRCSGIISALSTPTLASNFSDQVHRNAVFADRSQHAWCRFATHMPCQDQPAQHCGEGKTDTQAPAAVFAATCTSWTCAYSTTSKLDNLQIVEKHHPVLNRWLLHFAGISGEGYVSTND